MSAPIYSNDQSFEYILFDKKTGRILNTHSRFSIGENKSVEVPADELKEMFLKSKPLVDSLSDHDPANLDVISSGSGEGAATKGAMFMVDVKTRTLVPKPSLTLKSDKLELTGDGEDSTQIEIQAVNAEGKPVRDIDGTIKVTTTRGKLSARAGLVELRHGRATVTLTSVNETVSGVLVSAASPSGACARGDLKLEFV